MTRRVAFVGLLVTRVAFADPPPAAAELYRDGQSAYDQARYDDAIAAWQQSYALSHEPALLYNLAQALRLRGHSGDCVAARDKYREFVALVEPSPQRNLAERYIAGLASCASAPAGEPPTSSMTSTNHERLDERELTVAAIGLGGVGLVIAGIALGHHAATLGDDVTAACSLSCDWSAEKSKDAAGRRDSTLGWTFGTLGVVALVADAALYYFDVHEHGFSVGVGTSSAAVTWSRAW
ncbi:MAG TPA: hypothetical protein VGL61_31520 [Kofleriaceae bacterium]